MDVLVPIAAKDPDFEAAGYDEPKPLIEIRGQPMIEWAMSCVGWVNPSSYIFVVLETHIEEHDIDDRLHECFGPEIEIVSINGMTDGAAQTALKAEHHLSDEELIVLFGDQYVRGPVESEIKDSDSGGAIAVFESTDPCWSYARTDDDGAVTEVAEKKVISSQATCGLYYFTKGLDFIEGAERMIQADIRTNGLFYICPVYNQLIEMGRRVETFFVEEMWSLGTPEAVEQFEEQFKVG